MTQVLTLLLVLSGIESIFSAARLPHAYTDTLINDKETEPMSSESDIKYRYPDYPPGRLSFAYLFIVPVKQK